MLGKVKTNFGLETLIQLTNNECFRVRTKKKLDLAVGDHLQVATNNQISKLARVNELKRKTASLRIQIIAVNLTHVGIVVSKFPVTPICFIDQAIVACRYYSLEPIIIVTKLDLLDNEIFLDTIKAKYFNTVSICAPFNINFLPSKFRIALIGVSGSGKSTLVNKIIPNVYQKTGELNRKMFGNHTTSGAMLFDLPGGNEIIDTPGIRNLITAGMSADQIFEYFPGFENLYPIKCRDRKSVV